MFNDYNKLKVFLLVAKLGSLSRAASRLYRTQSAISQQIKQLEEELGFKLFERRGSTIRLTTEAQHIRNQILPAFDQIDQVIESTQGHLSQISGVVRVGTTPSIGEHAMVSLLKPFAKEYPDIIIELVYGPDEEIENMVWNNRVDFGLIIEFKKRERFLTKQIFQFNEIVVCSPKYKKNFESQFGPLLNYSQLSNMKFIDFGLDLPNIRHWLKKNTNQSKKILGDIHPVFVIENYNSVKKLVLENIGAAMLPSYLIDHGLISLFPNSQPTTVGVDLCWNKFKNQTNAIKVVHEFLLSKKTL